MLPCAALLLAGTIQGQNADLQRLDSLLLQPFPQDTLAFTGQGWVASSGALGHVLWSDSAWAWNPDTAMAKWTVRLGPSAAVLTLDLQAGLGTSFTLPLQRETGAPWVPATEEGWFIDRRYRVFLADGDSLWAVEGSGLPSAELLADWHRMLDPAARPLSPLPGKVAPVAFACPGCAGWRFTAWSAAPCSLATNGVRMFDPERTLMDVVREQRPQR